MTNANRSFSRLLSRRARPDVRQHRDHAGAGQQPRAHGRLASLAVTCCAAGLALLIATSAQALVGPGGSDFGRDPGRRDNGGSQPGGGISIGSDNGKNYDGTNGFKGPLQPAGSRYRDKNGVWRWNEPGGNQSSRAQAGGCCNAQTMGTGNNGYGSSKDR